MAGWSTCTNQSRSGTGASVECDFVAGRVLGPPEGAWAHRRIGAVEAQSPKNQRQIGMGEEVAVRGDHEGGSAIIRQCLGRHG